MLGTAAAVAAKRPDIGTAVALGGQHLGQQNFLSYSRTQESSADAAALTILDRTGQSAKGLLEFLNVIKDQELLSTSRQDAYLRTHPLTEDRLEAIKAHLKRSPYTDTPTPPKLVAMYKRMKAKLEGFMLPISQALRLYPASDHSIAGRYGRAIALYRRPDMPHALKLMNGLIAEFPRDPYFYEMKGQMLFENARAKEALEAYKAAAVLLPNAPLIQTQTARVMLEMNDPHLLKDAIKHLRTSLQAERDSAFTWHQLGIAYGRQRNIAQSSLALAEEALLKGDINAASFHAGRAEKLSPHGSRGWLQAQDILQEIHRRKKRKEE